MDVAYLVACLSKLWPQIREQILVPNLYVFAVKFEILQPPIKMDYNMKMKFFPKTHLSTDLWLWSTTLDYQSD